ncbi:unnamed protein product [[Candida] boidinii]|uniref:Unnamed protein product n=1 Tax=Candida boidinii TaxID=5477 RepID=A0A9W6WDR8_CANBO|nr:hypothetical protein B5S30_g1791 [[Candida] boidinii]GME66754.1 unnamed protein product [[Candida] boidinii]GMF51717.1 unnamed protein product [[Candida] boidinii]
MSKEADLSIKENPIVEKIFEDLANCELEMEKADKEVEIYRIKKTKPVYEKRRELFLGLPNLWYIVLAQHEDFQEYIQNEDTKYLEFITEIYVNWMDQKDSGENVAEDPRCYSITFQFKSPNGEIEEQKVTKYFKHIVDPETGEETLVSEKVDVKWPTEFDDINPNLIKLRAKENEGKMSTDEKKKYRTGMKSFFAFFDWTGKKPGKEYRNGEELATLIAEDVYPFATKYYTEAMTSMDDEDDDESSDELDLSADDDDEDEDDKEIQEPQKKRLKV